MTPQLWVTLIVAVLGVLHGPLFAPIARKVRKRKVSR